MIRNDINQIKSQYIDSAIQHGTASINGDYKIANKEYKKLEKIFKYISDMLEIREEFFLELLQNDDKNVRVWAGCHALNLNILVNESLSTLEKAALEGTGVANLNAKIALKQWEKEGKLGGKSW